MRAFKGNQAGNTNRMLNEVVEECSNTSGQAIAVIGSSQLVANDMKYRFAYMCRDRGLRCREVFGEVRVNGNHVFFVDRVMDPRWRENKGIHKDYIDQDYDVRS